MMCAQCGREIAQASNEYHYGEKQFCSQGCLDDFRRDTKPLSQQQS